MIRLGLRLDPLGPLLFRDGRPFDAATRASSGLPTPQTLAGALRTAMLTAWDGFDASDFRARRRDATARDALAASGAPDWLLNLRVRGPWLALATDDHGPVTPLLPTPAVLVRQEEDGQAPRWARNRPWIAGLPGWREAPQILPLWRDAMPEAAFPGGYLTLDGIARFLRGDCPEESHFRRADALYAFDDRVHVAIDANRGAALEGQLFSTRRLALKPRGVDPRREAGATFYAEVLADALPDEALRWLADRFRGEAIPFGGEGGCVAARRLERPVDWPSCDDVPAGAPGSLWLLANPAFVAAGRALPSGLAAERVRAAASREPLAVSGWDVALNGPRPTRYAVPAGSVYFVEAGTVVPPDQHDSLCDDPEDIAQGWGFALRGVWNSS